MLAFGGTIFVSAFLLFQVQPLISRVILPWYGGTAQVWTTCMMFFQFVLLAGYCYAHLVQSLPLKRQVTLHMVLLLIGLAFSQIMPGAHWKPTGEESPTLSILMLLGSNVGIPYFLASTTGPLLQAWFARLYPDFSPYRLYALSNVGSLLALVTYPAFFEVQFTLDNQTRFWMIGFIVFVVLGVICGALVYSRAGSLPTKTDSKDELELVEPGTYGLSNEARRARPIPSSASPTEVPTAFDHVLWLLLAACGSTLFLATTNQMCEDIAVVPFLYIMPLALYLLSFILTFDSNFWYNRPVWATMLIISSVVSIYVHGEGADANIVLQVISYCALVLCGCMICHGELARLKPAPKYLTSFYLIMSTGGAMGGLFVGVLAPMLFKGYWEFPMVHTAVYVLLVISLVRLGFNDSPSSWLGLVLLMMTVLGFVIHAGFDKPLTLVYYVIPITLVGWLFFRKSFNHSVGAIAVAIMAGFIALGARTFITKSREDGSVFRGRNFFGVVDVYTWGEGENQRMYLTNGRIDHGFQFTQEDMQLAKTSYYGQYSGIGLAIDWHPRNFKANGGPRDLRIGVVGLGSGSTAAYGKKGDVIRFYDINPMVKDIATTHFTYLEKTPAQTEVVLGDARIALERELQKGDKQNYDVIALDAFSSDAIPAHLLTLECMRIYMDHLRDPNEGIIAIHVSNRYLVLERICRKLAAELGMDSAKVENDADSSKGVYSSSWVLLSKNKAFFEHQDVKPRLEEWVRNEAPIRRVWTDDYYNLAEVVHWGMAWREIRNFPFEFMDTLVEKYEERVKDSRKEVERLNRLSRRLENFTDEEYERYVDMEKKYAKLKKLPLDDLTAEEKEELSKLDKYFKGESDDSE